MLEFDGEVDGDNTEYLQLRSYIQQNDLSNDENYNHVINQIDINNFMEYNIAQFIWITEIIQEIMQYWKVPVKNGDGFYTILILACRPMVVRLGSKLCLLF